MHFAFRSSILIAAMSLALACGDDAAPARDTGKPDTGKPDTGMVDTGMADTGVPDALGPCEALGEEAGWVQGESIVSSAEASPEAIRAAAAPTWDLALRMLRGVPRTEQANIAASPASLYFALGMTYARFEQQPCGERIATVLGYASEGMALHSALGASIRTLEGLTRPGDDQDGEIDLSLRQSIWDFRGAPVEPTSLDQLYGSTRHRVTSGAAARELINCVIEEQSRGLIEDFLPEGQPRSDTVSYDINVAFLVAGWGFEMGDAMVDFTPDDGPTASVPGVSAWGQQVDHFEGDGFVAIDVPFRQRLLSMLFVMPSEDATGGLAVLEASLSAADLQAALAGAATHAASLRLPKFSIDAKTLDYNERLGFACEPFTLRSVFHSAAVEIDKHGVRAAAASAAETWEDGGGGPEDPIDLFVDRPFLFFIHDPETGYVLFSGRYTG